MEKRQHDSGPLLSSGNEGLKDMGRSESETQKGLVS
jgi:hypothetical protein